MSDMEVAAALAELQRQGQMDNPYWNPLYVRDEGDSGMVLLDGHVDLPALVSSIMGASIK